MKKYLKGFARRCGYDIQSFHACNGKADPERPWEDDREFLELWDRIKGQTLLDRTRVFMLFQMARRAAALPGHYAECGVFRGGTALLLSICKPADKKLFLFDTFEGMPEVNHEHDYHRQGDFSETSLQGVQNLLAGRSNVIFRNGLFPKTAEELEDEVFSLVHVDFDIYQSVKDACEFFYPRLVVGGSIVFDDYGYASCPGAKSAVREFCVEKGTNEIYLPTGQALLFKFQP